MNIKDMSIVNVLCGKKNLIRFVHHDCVLCLKFKESKYIERDLWE